MIIVKINALMELRFLLSLYKFFPPFFRRNLKVLSDVSIFLAVLYLIPLRYGYQELQGMRDILRYCDNGHSIDYC